jgi:hypothetical protein
MLAFMAGMTMHIGHQAAYLYMFTMPYLLWYLLQAMYPKGSILRRTTYDVFIKRESMMVAAQREENSFHPQAPLREEEAKCAFLDGRDHQGKTQDLPCPNHGLCLQSWLSFGTTVEGVTCLTPSEGAPIFSPTNLYSSVERRRLRQSCPL